MSRAHHAARALTRRRLALVVIGALATTAALASCADESLRRLVIKGLSVGIRCADEHQDEFFDAGAAARSAAADAAP
jgi:hypothetical protein